MTSKKEGEWRQNVMQALAGGQLAQTITHQSGEEYNVASGYTIVVTEKIALEQLAISDVKNLLWDGLPAKTGSKSDFPILLGRTDHGIIFLDGQHRIADAVRRGDDTIAAYVLSIAQTARCLSAGVTPQDLQRLGFLKRKESLKPGSTESV